MLKTYITKPVKIEAMQYTGTNYSEICAFFERKISKSTSSMRAEETALINATPNQIKKRQDEGVVFNRMDRFLVITGPNYKYEIFKNDYVAYGKDGMLIYTDKTFNKLFIEQNNK